MSRAARSPLPNAAHRRPAAIVLAALALAVSAPRAGALDPGACYARSYGEAHLAAQPAQTVRALEMLVRDASGAAEARSVVVRALFRDSDEVFTGWLFCMRSAPTAGLPPGAFSCYVECDGGVFHAWHRNADTLMMVSEGFVVAGGCGEPDEELGEAAEAPPTRFVIDDGARRTTFRLDRVERRSCGPWPAPD